MASSAQWAPVAGDEADADDVETSSETEVLRRGVRWRLIGIVALSLGVVAILLAVSHAVRQPVVVREDDLEQPQELFLGGLLDAAKTFQDNQMRLLDRMEENLQFRVRNDASTQACKDSPPWWANGANMKDAGYTYDKNHTSAGWNCDAYKNWGWCANGVVFEDEEGVLRRQGSFGSIANDPETHCCVCGGGDEMNSVEPMVTAAFSALGRTTIVGAIVDLLVLSASDAVKACSRKGGFALDHDIRIRAPAELSSLADLGVQLSFGYGGESIRKAMTILEESMNTAAEAASELALPSLQAAAKNANTMAALLQNAKVLWASRDGGATQFLEWSTNRHLAVALAGRCRAVLENAGVVRQYEAITSLLKPTPFYRQAVARGFVLPDILAYTVEQTLAGVYFLMRQSEMRLRVNPETALLGDNSAAANVISRIREVFAALPQRSQLHPQGAQNADSRSDLIKTLQARRSH